MIPRSRYITTREQGVLCVVDLNLPGSKSVTNDMEDVVVELSTTRQLQPGERLFLYCDSQRIWDGVAIKDGRFVSFIPLNQRQLSDAIVAIQRRGQRS